MDAYVLVIQMSRTEPFFLLCVLYSKRIIIGNNSLFCKAETWLRYDMQDMTMSLERILNDRFFVTNL